MATENRSRFNNAMVPGLFALAKDEFKRYPDTWTKFWTIRNSKRAYEESGYISGLGYLQEKKESKSVVSDARIQGPIKRWVHKAWALKVIISHEAIEDGLYGVMKGAMKDLVVSAAATRHLEAMKPIMNGSVTTYNTAGDGKAIFAIDHDRLDGGTWSNLAAAAADPTTATVEATVKNFENIVDHRGKRYDQKATGIWCGPGLEFTMSSILESQKIAENNFNAKNTLATRRSLELIIDPEISDNRWGVIGRKDSNIGFIWFDREKPRVTRHGDPDTGDTVFTIYGRWSNEVNDPRQMYMVPST